MVAKLIYLLKSLLLFWALNLIAFGSFMFIVVLIGQPIITLIFVGKFELILSLDLIQKTAKFVVWAAFWTGTILWVKQEFFPDKK